LCKCKLRLEILTLSQLIANSYTHGIVLKPQTVEGVLYGTGCTPGASST